MLQASNCLARVSDARAAKIEALVAPALRALGFDIVRVMLSGDRRPRLQIMIEPSEGGNVGVDDCAEVSRTVEAILDVEEPLSGSYLLEISSPGLDRPLTRPEDFSRFAGFEAKLEMKVPIDGRRRFRGRLLGVEGSAVVIAVDQGETLLAIDDILRAKLVLTEDLIAAGQAGQLEPAELGDETRGK